MRKGLEILLFLAFLVLLSTTYIVYNWPYTPQEVLEDIEFLGPFGLLLDLLLIGLFIRWVKKGKKTDR